MKNKMSISLLCLSDMRKIDNFLKILNKQKISYIEVPIPKISRDYRYNLPKLRKFKKKLKKYSIKVSSIQSIFYKKNYNILKKKSHKQILKHLDKVFKISKFFDAKNIIFGSPKNRYVEKKNDDYYHTSLIFFYKVLKLAKKYNINFCIEPNSRFYNCNFITNISEGINLASKINSKKFLINADTGNIFLEKDKCVSAKKHYKMFGNFQIAEKNLISLSKGKINHIKILKKFKIRNKFISLEMLNSDFKLISKDISKFRKIVSKINDK